ncbi:MULTISPECIES: hypothetical protein [unclassified Halorubrum]|uniref:hypothetical protein n=1 Tax=unclassified Halorubrum TaxID=2642239 RepID=UPI000B98DD59|nr:MULTISPECIES: hypothetical protein [unclassified Halorubrum]OYR44959.1 hypothetical protein DJ81_06085 [Halorubrum sp. Hd13]OYR50361.1 hypothetical protein DJ73_16155 [Halorubrum sp. Ea1]OYR50757.1 hypothetical protein DJ74_05385 [Halorubrum sp. Ea8]
MPSVDPGLITLAALGVAFALVALASLRPASRFRRLYGVDDADNAGARANAAVLGGTGAFLVALAAAIALGVPDRTVAVGALGVAAVGTVALGWLVRYRDRRDLLTTPDVSRERARRLGGAAIWAGLLLCLPLVGVLLGASEASIVVAALGGSVVTLLLVALAYR